jgi:hypothetical protein
LRTKRDRELRVCWDFPVAEVFNFDEIAALRKMIRVLGPASSASDGAEAYARGTEVLKAWADHSAARAANEAASGYAAALSERDAASMRFEEIATKLARMRAATFEGIFAKVRATMEVFGDDDGMTHSLCVHLREFGADDENIAASVARDLAAMVRNETLR